MIEFQIKSIVDRSKSLQEFTNKIISNVHLLSGDLESIQSNIAEVTGYITANEKLKIEIEENKKIIEKQLLEMKKTMEEKKKIDRERIVLDVEKEEVRTHREELALWEKKLKEKSDQINRILSG